MATQTILFAAASGLTIPTVRLFSGTSDTIAATASATERTNAKGIYAADYTDLTAGLYRLVALDSNSTTLAVWWVRCAGGNSTAHATETPDATEWTQARAGYMDSMLQASNANQRTVQVTGSNHIAADVHAFQPNVIDAAAIAADAVTEIQAGLATAANLTIVSDRVSYCLTALVGACSDAQTAAETYTLSIGGSTFTVDYSGLDASGNRSTTTLTKV
jgi:hypothetical protein